MFTQFYNESIRRAVIGFGSLFNDIRVIRKNADGTTKEITGVRVGEETKGGRVIAKLEFEPTKIYNYQGVYVSGTHLVREGNEMVEVQNSKHGILTDRIEPVYCFETTNNRIWVQGIEFGDCLVYTSPSPRD